MTQPCKNLKQINEKKTKDFHIKSQSSILISYFQFCLFMVYILSYMYALIIDYLSPNVLVQSELQF